MNENKTNINWYPGHMAKTKREIKEKLDLIDVVLEVIDARMPISSKIVDIDDYIKNKPRILIVTKYDICDKEKTNRFIEYYKNMGYDVVYVDLINGKVTGVIDKCKEYMISINNKRKEKGLKPKAIRALVVGVPNVGKSTLINRLVGKKAASVGNRPGVTKNLGWIRINRDIELLDSPGILWPKIENDIHALNLASLSSIKEEILDSERLAFYIIEKMKKSYPELLKNRYNLTSLEDTLSIIEEIGRNRKALAKGAEVDLEKTYSIIIRDLKEGLFGNVTFDEVEDGKNR